MGTQATLALLRGGKVVRKIVAGCNGMEIQALERHLKRDPTDDPSKLQELCKKLKVGCDNCLVIQTDKHTSIGLEGCDEDTLNRYANHFDDPIFNPRWDAGIAPYSLVPHLDKICKS